MCMWQLRCARRYVRLLPAWSRTVEGCLRLSLTATASMLFFLSFLVFVASTGYRACHGRARVVSNSKHRAGDEICRRYVAELVHVYQHRRVAMNETTAQGAPRPCGPMRAHVSAPQSQSEKRSCSGRIGPGADYGRRLVT